MSDHPGQPPFNLYSESNSDSADSLPSTRRSPRSLSKVGQGDLFLANNAINFESDSDSPHPSYSGKKSGFLQVGSFLGRYRIGAVLGHGGYGIVYQAEDEELHRTVAIKIPLAERMSIPEEGKTRYLKEARILAGLDHPHIVPIYDIGITEDGLPYIVSKYISGCTLAERIRRSRLSILESVELILRMTDALSYAHDHQLVHRDIKPGNIALENGEKPYLIDFGLAEIVTNLEHLTGMSGTPAYMSPEQAKGENHLVDGRSDIYSLGVVFFELLVGEKPHEAEGVIELLLNITKYPPRSLREIDISIPVELERIVMKCLSKKADSRYSKASELADDLRHWLNREPAAEKKFATSIKIVPKGLRSFEASDSDFYLGLLPGARDRDGLPESIRFWKNRLEESDASKTFRVGVIYGPSGCGKSSFAKAGLLPRLASRLRVAYVEAHPGETELRLVRALERACPDLAKNLKLRDAINHIRRMGDSRRKVVLFIDQFEQWLLGKNSEEDSELVCALRQCDGEKVQCVLLVRDDFWLALNRFMQALEIKLLESQNAVLIDLFDLAHARKVLHEFGRAYGALPEDGRLSSEQDQFLTRSVMGLAQSEKVISVRLSLFAEMMKGRPWTPRTLAEVGGADGIGVTFLEETFASRSAPANRRIHQEGARGVLRALLPGTGTNIKGSMRSRIALQLASGYGDRTEEFDDLMAMLDGELRLVTPTDTNDLEINNSDDPRPVRLAGEYYQLTHDYLISSLREWLTRKQKETKKGQAELLLEDRSVVWNSRSEIRQLPSMFEWIRIRRMIPRKSWTLSQAKMMANAGRYHGVRIASFLFLSAIAMGTGILLLSQYSEKRTRIQIAQSHLQKARENLSESLAFSGNIESKVKGLESNRDSVLMLIASNEVAFLRDDFDALLKEINFSLGKASRDHNDARLAIIQKTENAAILELKLLAQEDQKLLHDLRKIKQDNQGALKLIEDTKAAIAKEIILIAEQLNLLRQHVEAIELLGEAERQILADENADDNVSLPKIGDFSTLLSGKISLALADIYHTRGVSHWYLFMRLEGLRDYETELQLRLRYPVKETSPDYRDSQRALAIAYGFLGDAHLEIANYSKTKECYAFAREIRKNLAESEAANSIADKCMHARDFGNVSYLGMYVGDEESVREQLGALRDGVRYYEDQISGKNLKLLPKKHRFERIHRRLDLVEVLLNESAHPIFSLFRFYEIDEQIVKMKEEFNEFKFASAYFDENGKVVVTTEINQLSPDKLTYLSRILLAESRFELVRHVFFRNSQLSENTARRLEVADNVQFKLDLSGKANVVNFYVWAQIIAMKMQLADSQNAKENLFVLLEDRLRKSVGLGFDIYHRFIRDRTFDEVRFDAKFKTRFKALETLVHERELAKEAIRKKFKN